MANKPPEQTRMFDLPPEEIKPVTPAGFTPTLANANPCIALYGAGPTDTNCSNCKHLLAFRYSKTYYKCELREITKGPATDHRARWPSCGRYTSGGPKEL